MQYNKISEYVHFKNIMENETTVQDNLELWVHKQMSLECR